MPYSHEKHDESQSIFHVELAATGLLLYFPSCKNSNTSQWFRKYVDTSQWVRKYVDMNFFSFLCAFNFKSDCASQRLCKLVTSDYASPKLNQSWWNVH